MKTNAQLQKDVQDALKWEPLLNAAEIGVIVKDGIVTLTGTVDNYLKKAEAENAAKNVAGVKVIVEQIDVNLGHAHQVTDSEIAREVLNAFKWNSLIPESKIKVKVENGKVTLDGELDWNYERNVAGATVANLVGVKGVHNNTTIRLTLHDVSEAKVIKKALDRNWSLNSNNIEVSVSGTKVTLSGVVSSWFEKEEAERIAWKASGILAVSNDLIVEFDFALID